MPSRRPASVAGRWYPSDRTVLAAEVDEYIARANIQPPSGRLWAIIAPHAGLTYSGPVAAFAYKMAVASSQSQEGFGAVVLVGPSHFVPFDGVSLWSDGAWDTPFGPVDVDQELASALRSKSGEIVDVPGAHSPEHSLEMQLPFIAHLMPRVPIVPLVMGHQTRDTAFSLGKAIADSLSAHATESSRARVLLVASSDLSHYEDARVARRLDSLVMDHIERLDPDGLMTALEHEPRHACGGGPMVAVLHAARLLGATDARLLRYADSGDVTGDKSSVVGYLAASIT